MAIMSGAGEAIEIARAALELAAAGFPVFPCNAKKKPVVTNGFLSASTDPAIVRVLFAKRATKLIGVPTGPASEVDVLDFDYRHGAKPWEDANQYRLPETRVHQSQSGGRHLLFRHTPGIRNSAGRIAPGCDVRGAGGYIIMPPSPGYTVISDAPIAPWPEWLLEPGLALPKLKPPPRPVPPRPTFRQVTNGLRPSG
jgi:Bifunctional DNA primase/polymerase, N-terminal